MLWFYKSMALAPRLQIPGLAALSARIYKKGVFSVGKVVIHGKTVLLMKAELRESGEHVVGDSH